MHSANSRKFTRLNVKRKEMAQSATSQPKGPTHWLDVGGRSSSTIRLSNSTGSEDGAPPTPPERPKMESTTSIGASNGVIPLGLSKATANNPARVTMAGVMTAQSSDTSLAT